MAHHAMNTTVIYSHITILKMDIPIRTVGFTDLTADAVSRFSEYIFQCGDE